MYVTDPSRPLGSRDSRIWRHDPDSGATELLARLGAYANGLGFASADDWLYVANTDDATIVRFPIVAGRLGLDEVVAGMVRVGPTGSRSTTTTINLVVATVMLNHDQPGEIQTWLLDGVLVDVIQVPIGRLCTNVCLTPDGLLYSTVTDTGQLLVFPNWSTKGLPLHPFRTP